MAVTYAWRLDSNKYAYILPPYKLEACTGPKTENNPEAKYSLEYGFLSNTPLTDYFLRAVGTAAEDKFGKNSEGGLAAYQDAFDAMLAKISGATNGALTQIGENEITTISDWKGLGNADILSADVYFNVDSENCADLRGVGIKGTRYLGSIKDDNNNGVDINSVTYQAASETVRAGMPGYIDVYGIYMEDNPAMEDPNSGVIKNAPEYMFVIRNGKDGAQGPQGEKGDENTNDLSEYAKKTDLEALSKRVDDLADEISKLDLETILQRIGNIEGLYNTLLNEFERLKSYVDDLNEKIDNSNNNDNNDGPTTIVGGGSKIEIVPLGDVSGDRNDYDYEEGATEDGDIDGWYGEPVNDKVFHLLGYLEQDGYLSVDGGGLREMPEVTRLYSLPNIGVTLKGVTFGVEREMDLYVNGNTHIEGDAVVMDNIKAKNLIASNKSYVKEGFYQATPEEIAEEIGEEVPIIEEVEKYNEFSTDPSENN